MWLNCAWWVSYLFPGVLYSHIGCGNRRAQLLQGCPWLHYVMSCVNSMNHQDRANLRRLLPSAFSFDTQCRTSSAARHVRAALHGTASHRT